MEQLHINCTNCTMTAGQPKHRTKTLQQWTDKARSNFIGDFLLQPKSWVENKEI